MFVGIESYITSQQDGVYGVSRISRMFYSSDPLSVRVSSFLEVNQSALPIFRSAKPCTSALRTRSSPPIFSMPMSPSARPHTGMERDISVSPDETAHYHTLRDVRPRKSHISLHTSVSDRARFIVSKRTPRHSHPMAIFFGKRETLPRPLFSSPLPSPCVNAVVPTQTRTCR